MFLFHRNCSPRCMSRGFVCPEELSFPDSSAHSGELIPVCTKAQMATRRGVLSLLAWHTAERAQACVLSLKSPSHSGLNQRRTRGPRDADLQDGW